MSRARHPADSATGLFERDSWHPRSPVRAFDVRFRLGCRGAFPDGLTPAERAALKRIAAGETVAGLDIDRQTARAALAAPWLR